MEDPKTETVVIRYYLTARMRGALDHFDLNRVAAFVLGVALFCAACHGGTKGGPGSTIEKEIPTYFGGSVDIFYQLAKDRQKQLGLDSLENGFPGLQIRIWCDAARSKEKRLVVISNTDSLWKGEVYDFAVGQAGETDSVVSRSTRAVVPRSGWSSFTKRLLDLQIMTLPNQDDVEGYSAGKDGRMYNVEVGTKNQYRFYGYWEPQRNQEKFWQAKKMTEILQLIDTELGL